METVTLRDLRRRPMAAVVMPLPTELTTPPVTNMYFVPTKPPSSGGLASAHSGRCPTRRVPKPDDTGAIHLSVKRTAAIRARRSHVHSDMPLRWPLTG